MFEGLVTYSSSITRINRRYVTHYTTKLTLRDQGYYYYYIDNIIIEERDYYFCYFDKRYLQFIVQIWEVSNVQRVIGTDRH